MTGIDYVAWLVFIVIILVAVRVFVVLAQSGRHRHDDSGPRLYFADLVHAVSETRIRG